MATPPSPMSTVSLGLLNSTMKHRIRVQTSTGYDTCLESFTKQHAERESFIAAQSHWCIPKSGEHLLNFGSDAPHSSFPSSAGLPQASAISNPRAPRVL